MDEMITSRALAFRGLRLIAAELSKDGPLLPF